MAKAKKGMPYTQAVCETVQNADGPMTFAEIASAVAEMPVRQSPKPDRAIRSALRNSLLIVPTDEERYAWALWFLKGATVRHALTGRELAEGSLRLGVDVCYILFPFLHAPRYHRARPCHLYLEQGPLFSQRILPLSDGAAGIPPSYALSDWFEFTECRAGDNLLFEVTDGEEGIYHVFLQRPLSQDEERLKRRGAELAQAVGQTLARKRRPYPLFRLMPALVARRLYHDPFPPPPLEAVITGSTFFETVSGKVRVLPHEPPGRDYLPGFSPHADKDGAPVPSQGVLGRLFGRKR